MTRTITKLHKNRTHRFRRTIHNKITEAATEIATHQRPPEITKLQTIIIQQPLQVMEMDIEKDNNKQVEKRNQ